MVRVSEAKPQAYLFGYGGYSIFFYCRKISFLILSLRKINTGNDCHKQSDVIS